MVRKITPGGSLQILKKFSWKLQFHSTFNRNFRIFWISDGQSICCEFFEGFLIWVWKLTEDSIFRFRAFCYRAFLVSRDLKKQSQLGPRFLENNERNKKLSIRILTANNVCLQLWFASYTKANNQTRAAYSTLNIRFGKTVIQRLSDF